MSGPSWNADELRHVPTLTRIQQDLLGDEDLLLDFFLGPSRSYLFAITRDSCRVSVLPAEAVLEQAVRLYYDIIQSPRFETRADDHVREAATRTDDGLREAGSRLHANLLGSMKDLMQTHRRIIVCPDGVLNLLPFGSLGDPIGMEFEWIRIPSVAILNEIRSRAADPQRAAAGVLALANEAAPTGRLQGVLDEVGNLDRSYRSTEARFVSDQDTVNAAELAAVPAILHIACHAQTDDERPWLSSFRLGALGLRAGQIANARIPARLAVLSSCQTQHGKVLSGEGVLGLSAALLSAGAECVVATLWPVEDRATARFCVLLCGLATDGA
jgi:CHAT domain-containing protein